MLDDAEKDLKMALKIFEDSVATNSFNYIATQDDYAILLSKKYCPISFRTVDSLVYKKAMLVFYEQNNIYPCKKIFIEQFDFAVNNYF